MIFLGVDVGQASDPSALVGVRVREGRVVVAGAEERALGERYAELIAAVDDRCRCVEQHGQRVVPVVDATGVGRPVLEGLRQIRPDSVGITITAGTRHGGVWPDWRVPKRLLVHTAAAGMESGEVELPDRDRWPVLHDQIRSLRHKRRGRVEASGAGHDDLVLSWLYAVYAVQIMRHPGLEQRLKVRGHGVVAA